MSNRVFFPKLPWLGWPSLKEKKTEAADGPENTTAETAGPESEAGGKPAMGQNLRYLFSRDYHLFKRLFKGHRGYGVLTQSQPCNGISGCKLFFSWLNPSKMITHSRECWCLSSPDSEAVLCPFAHGCEELLPGKRRRRQKVQPLKSKRKKRRRRQKVRPLKSKRKKRRRRQKVRPLKSKRKKRRRREKVRPLKSKRKKRRRRQKVLPPKSKRKKRRRRQKVLQLWKSLRRRRRSKRRIRQPFV